MVILILVAGSIIAWQILRKKKAKAATRKDTNPFGDAQQVVSDAEEIFREHGPVSLEAPQVPQQRPVHVDDPIAQARGAPNAYSEDMFSTPHMNPHEPYGPASHQKSFHDTQQGSARTLNTKEFFDLVQGQKKTVVVAFVSDGCGHCQDMKPKYHEAAKMSRLGMFLVDYATDPKPAESLNINGFPTILRFEQGEPVQEYQGDRSTESLIAFAQ